MPRIPTDSPCQTCGAGVRTAEAILCRRAHRGRVLCWKCRERLERAAFRRWLRAVRSGRALR
jgi:hypothetical protein